jgi:RND family efflux transporter MFP subunit
MLRSLVLLILGLSWASASLAGPGHDHEHGHDHGPATAAASREAPRLESAGANLELVAIADGAELVIYLDRAATNEPVDGASIEVSMPGKQPLAAERSEAGTYKVEADWLEEPGTKALVFTIFAGNEAELLNGLLEIPIPQAETASVPHSLFEVASEPAGWAMMAVGLVLGLMIAFLIRPRTPAGTASAALIGVLLAGWVPTPVYAHEGHDHADEPPAASIPSGNLPRRLPDGSIFLPKPTQRLLEIRTRPAAAEQASQTLQVIGSVISDPSTFGQVQAPMDGLIELGQRGLSFIGQRVEAGEILARLSPTIPLADLGTMQQLRAEVAGKLKVAEQKLTRLSRISGVVAQSDIEDTRAELEALREQMRVLEAKDVQKFDLAAPVSGVISVANVHAGQVVSARDTLFEIVDPERLWVEASGSDMHVEEDITGGVALDADGHTIKLSYIGRSPMLRQQSQSLLFRIDEPHTGLAVGAPVTVIAQRRKTDEGIILPDAAVVRGAHGLSQVWVKKAAENFHPVPVRVRPLDGERVLILAGLEEGDRVVTAGAELINQVR